MKTVLITYMILINLCGLASMGIDKWKAKRGRWRISEKSLFLIAILGGSIGSLVGMYLFHHKTRHLRFTIGIPVILVLQLLAVVFFGAYRKELLPEPSAVVEKELSLIRSLDETTIHNFISYETMMGADGTAASPDTIGPETGEAVKLFFQHFDYQLHSENITNNTAIVTADIINIDTETLARDLRSVLTARSLNLRSDNLSPRTLNDYYILLRDTLHAHSYSTSVTSASFHLNRTDNGWGIESDETLQNALVSNFISWMNDPDLLSPEDVLSIWMDEFSTLNAREWSSYLKVSDIFSTGSEAYASSIDEIYMEKIADFFSWNIESCSVDGSDARAVLTVTSADMPYILESYHDRLVRHSRTSEFITDDESALLDASAKYLLEAFEEEARPGDFQITVNLHNDGHTWQPEISAELTNAFLGNIEEALNEFQNEN